MDRKDIFNVAGICAVIALAVGALAWEARSDNAADARPSQGATATQAQQTDATDRR